MRPVNEDQDGEQGERGDPSARCGSVPMMKPSVAGRFAARIPERMPMTILSSKQKEDDSRCSSVRRQKSDQRACAKSSTPPTVADVPALTSARLPGQKAARRRWQSPCLRVRRPRSSGASTHRRSYLQFGERGPRLRQALRQIGAIRRSPRRSGEVLAVVLEHFQSVLVELGVGRRCRSRRPGVRQWPGIASTMMEAAQRARTATGARVSNPKPAHRRVR